MTPTLATICFESAYLLCHVNAIDAHLMRIQFDSLWMRIEIGLQRASCERPFRQEWDWFVNVCSISANLCTCSDGIFCQLAIGVSYIYNLYKNYNVKKKSAEMTWVPYE